MGRHDFTPEEEILFARVATDFAERTRAGEVISESEYLEKLPTENLRAACREHIAWSGMLSAMERAKKRAFEPES